MIGRVVATADRDLRYEADGGNYGGGNSAAAATMTASETSAFDRSPSIVTQRSSLASLK